MSYKYNLVNYCEINEYASKAYSAIHGVSEEKNLVDVTDKTILEKLKGKRIDLITHGSPCQDMSIAGKQNGADKGSGTRSSLLWNSLEIIKNTNPKFVIWENVANALAPQHKHNVDEYIKELDDSGYNSYCNVLNAADYGIPQARKRVFIVSVKKEIDTGFNIPEKKEIKKSLKGLSDFRSCDNITKIFLNTYKDKKDVNATYDSFMTYVRNLPTTKGVGKKKLGLSHFNEYDGVTTLEGITGTLSCRNVQNYCLKYLCDDGIYKPSPKMCYRLMGFSDDDFEKSRVALNDNDHQLYDRAGNSIVVDVPLAIYRELFKDKREMLEDFNVLSLFSGIGAFEKALDEYYKEVM